MPAPVYRDGRSQSEFHFKQKASQMMTLVKFLPLAIGESIPEGDEHWSCFLVFWEICKISLAFEIREEDAGHLGWLVAIFLEMFSFLYSEGVNITPKMHHLVHLPDQILRFGPLRNTWCMRFESKNKEMKQYTSYCFKNVPLSVTIRHQQSLCYLLTVRPGTTVSSFLYPGDQVLGGSMCSVYEEIADDLAAAFGLDKRPQPFSVLRPSAVKIHGILYKQHAVVRVKSCEEDGSRGHDYCNIYVYNDMKVFVVEVLHVCSFVDHLKAYHVIPIHKYIIVHYNDLYSHEVLHIKEKNSRLYVVESSYFCNYE